MSLVLTAAQMRAVDRAAMVDLGLPGIVLMENAGRGVVDLINRHMPLGPGLVVTVVCGAGQNGGDGFVIARHLANQGARVTVLLAAAATRISGDAAVFAGVVNQLKAIPQVDLSGETTVTRWVRELAGSAVIVDALFGTGLRADVTGAAAAAIVAMNQTPALRVAVDIPSGLDADTGVAPGVAVAADITATMGCRKLGLVLDAAARVGQVVVVDLGVSIDGLAAAARAVGPLCHWLEPAAVGKLLPRRASTAHKGSAGHLLLIAGSPGKTGAAVLAARAALRGGAGLVTVASTGAGQVALDAKLVEAMSAAYAVGDDAEADSFGRLADLAGGMRAVAIGPGIPTGPAMKGLVARLVADLPRPMVVDADALNLLGGAAAAVLRGAPAARVLTPHPGEMGRLLGMATAEVQRDRLGCARRLAAEANAVVVLKGARTVIATPDGTAYINPAATAALATGGSGDVLTGLVGALLVQGLAAVDAACAAVFVHGQAAESAIATLGTQHLIAGDLPEGVARVLDNLDSGLSFGAGLGTLAP